MKLMGRTKNKCNYLEWLVDKLYCIRHSVGKSETFYLGHGSFEMCICGIDRKYIRNEDSQHKSGNDLVRKTRYRKETELVFACEEEM